MECSEPGAIRDEELIAYLVGDTVRSAVEQHLARCQACSARLATYQRIDLQLTSKLYRWDCPSSQELGEYQLSLLGMERTAAITEHLRRCVLCSTELVTLTEFLANDSLLVEKPAIALSAPAASNHRHPVQQAQRAIGDLRERTLAGAQRIVAMLLPMQPGFAAQRATGSQEQLWPRRYAADDVSVSLQVERISGRKGALQLLGFVARQGCSLEELQGTPVQLMNANTGAIITQQVDDLGNFVFAELAPETYVLEVQFSEKVVVIEQIVVTGQE